MAELYTRANNHSSSDLDMFLRINETGSVTKVYEEDAINQSIKTILSTIPGERLMMPQFGSRIRAILFEPLDEFTVNVLKLEIQDAINRWEPRINLNYVNVAPDYDRNAYEITVSYSILTTGMYSQFDAKIRSFA